MEQMDKQPEVRMRFIQSRLPTDLYEWLRLRAFLLRQSMNSIVLEAVARYRPTLEAGGGTPPKGGPPRRPVRQKKRARGQNPPQVPPPPALFAPGPHYHPP